MSIRPRGKSFMVDVKVLADRNPSGEDVRVRVTAKTRDDAIRLEALIRAEVMTTGRWSAKSDEEMAAARSTVSRTTGTLKDALKIAWEHPDEGWHKGRKKSADCQYRNAKMVIDFLGENTLCCNIERADFTRANKHLQEQGNSGDTITRKLQAFSRVLYFAQLEGWIKARPDWKRAPPSKARQFTFTPDLEAKVIDYFLTVAWDEDMADLFRLGIDTGCRLGELLAITKGDVDLHNQFLTVRGLDGVTKNGEVRTAALNKRACEVLRRRIDGLDRDDRLFPGWNNVKVSRRMVQVRNAMGYEGEREFTFHATRHTCGTRMANAEVPLLMMMGQLGHKTPSMTQRYVKMAPSAMRDTILRAMGEGVGQ